MLSKIKNRSKRHRDARVIVHDNCVFFFIVVSWHAALCWDILWRKLIKGMYRAHTILVHNFTETWSFALRSLSLKSHARWTENRHLQLSRQICLVSQTHSYLLNSFCHRIYFANIEITCAHPLIAIILVVLIILILTLSRSES